MDEEELKISAEKYERRRCGFCGRKLCKNILFWDDKKPLMFCKKCKVAFLPYDYYLNKDFVIENKGDKAEECSFEGGDELK